MSTTTRNHPFWPSKPLYALLIICLGVNILSCEKIDLSPVLGTYVGESRIEIWSFEELRDNDGNLTGVVVVRDTTLSQGDVFTIVEGDEKGHFKVMGNATLARINGFSSHQFQYEGQQEFSVTDVSNGVENKRLEIVLDGTGNVSFLYNENEDNGDRPPTGQSISFSGTLE